MVLVAREHYAPYRWVQAAVMVLALWLVTSPVSLGYRSAALAWSDALSGVASLALAVVALSPRRGWASWAQALVGVWLLFAPLAFWAPDPVAYANDTLVGTLLVTFGFLIPMSMPMAAFQLGHVPEAWDPFFGRGTERILASEVSRVWPVPDAGLGAMTYLVEARSGFNLPLALWLIRDRYGAFDRSVRGPRGTSSPAPSAPQKRCRRADTLASRPTQASVVTTEERP